ncbi:MAG: hypothetical protein ACOX2Z_00005 [Minisyncoccales bacterium]
MSKMQYKEYFDFSGGYNDTTVQDLLKDNELSVCENIIIKQKGELNLRDGVVKINSIPKGFNITKRYEYFVLDNSIILEVYDKKLYKVGNPDTLLTTLNSDKPYFLQQQNVLYCCDGKEIYEIGNKDYFSNIKVDIKKDDIIQITDDFSVEELRGKFFKALKDMADKDLSTTDFTVAEDWTDVTDILGATSNVVRPLKAYNAGKKEKVIISVFDNVTNSGYVSIYLDNEEYQINVTSGQTARDVATAIANTSFTGYTATVSQNEVTIEANEIGYKENCYASSYNTGVSMVVNTTVNGQINDNILSEVKNCTKFIHHTKSGRYVATGNPKKPFAVYFSEPMQLNYFKEFNILNPSSSDGTAVCLVNIIDSVLVGYRHSWYEYTGLDPAVDGTWRKLAIPYGCASEYSVQVLDLYSFVFLADNGLYLVSANVLNQYEIVMQNATSVKNISEDKIYNTIKTIFDKSKCVSVYHDSIYYLAYNDNAGENSKIILYYTDKKAFTLFTGIQVNDFLYRKNGDLEIASLNYALRFDDTVHYDTDVTTGENKRIEFEIKTTNLTLDTFIAEKFIDKIFVQANIGAETFDEHLRLLIRIDYLDTDMITIDLSDVNSGLTWGNPWGSPWGNYSTQMQSAFIRMKGNRIGVGLTNKGLEDINTNFVFYGFAISFKQLIPFQKLSNNIFGNLG